ncbi:MAG: PKD domain-containing protein, partial [Promethearchaeota archaeon]
KKSTEPKGESPIASFSYSVNGREVQFIDESTDRDGEITAWEWKFGDGSRSTVQNPTHRYTNLGTFEVFLTVTDNGGNTCNCSQIIGFANQSPSASFTYSVDGCVVQFSDQSTDTEGEIVAWDWKFGDESVSNIQNPIYQYKVAGTYDVVLVVTNNVGAKDTASESITVYCDYTVYNNSGIPEDAEVWTWDGSDWEGPIAIFDASYSDSTAPEVDTCFKTTSGSNWDWHTNYAGWGVFLIKPSDHTVDLSAYAYLKFWVKTSENLKIEIQQDHRYGLKFKVYLANHGWDGDSTWQEISIPVDTFSGVNLEKIFCPFMITVEQGDKTFYVDDVRWVDEATWIPEY